MIWFTEVDKTSIIFQFKDKELPEEVPFPYKVKLNKIEYPGGHRTNQIIGVYLNDIEWSGVFFGTYTDDAGNKITALQRANNIIGESPYKGKGLLGRPLRIGFPAPADGAPIPGVTKNSAKDSKEYKNGFAGIFVIEDFIIKIKNPLHVEYTMKLVPHERQEKVIPKETVTKKITYNYNNINAGVARVKKHGAKISGSSDVIKSVNETGLKLNGTINQRSVAIEKYKSTK